MKKLFVLLAMLMMASVAHATTRYVSFTNGSNANDGLAKTLGGGHGPWKSVAGMQTAAGCGGATPAAPAAGDQIIFEGGDTWPPACFQWTITAGGTSGAQTYYGVDKTWFIGSSWTRPKFDMMQTVPTGDHVIVAATSFPGFVTFDNLEIANQGVHFTTTQGDGAAYDFNTISGSLPGVLIEYGNIHDWITNDDLSVQTGGNQHYGGGAIYDGHDRITVDHTILNDAGGWVFAGATKHLGGFGGTCVNCGTVSNDTFVDGWGACFTTVSCHDNEMSGVTQTLANCVHSATCSANSLNVHTQVVEDDYGCSIGMRVYNNYIHDNSGAGVTIYVNYSTFIYNNVMRNNSNGNINIGEPGGCHIGSGQPSGYVLNNTVDGSNGIVCFATDSKGTIPGPLTRNNNICVTNGTEISIVSAITTFTNGPNNYKMSTTEASSFGFTSANKYKPTSSDSNVTAKGTNYTSSCTGGLSFLCQDTSGAPWFGGSSILRPTSPTAWDLGAFQGQGGATGPPSCSFTSPMGGPHSGTLTLTVTCTPQGTATISSVQFFIDGFPFGAADTSSPYTTTWDTNTASNARAHAITAVGTDSNAQTGPAGPISVTPTNTHPNGFVSDNLWSPNIPNQPFTAQTSSTVVYPICITPYTTTNNDNEVMLSQALPTTYSDASAIVAIRGGGYIQVYNGGTSTYTTDAGPTAYPVVASTQYCFNWTVDMTDQTNWLAETSPVAQTIVASPGYAFRNTPVTSLGFLSAFATTNSTPDTVEVANFTTPSTPALTFNPGNLTFPDTVAGATSTQTDAVTIASGPASISGVVLAGTGFTLDASSTCPSSGSLSSACTYVVDFTPPSVGTFTGTLTVTGNQSGSPQVFNLSGNGVAVAPVMTASQTTLNVGNTLPHHTISAGPATLTITNGPATITSVAYVGGNAADFGFASNDCPGSVMTSCQVLVSFTPTIIGTETTTLRFTSSDASNSPVDVTVTGQGVTTFPVAVSPHLMLR